MPAILKGYFDRIMTVGFAYDLPQGDSYGDGLMKGKKAMLLVTLGGRSDQFGPRGIHGPIEDLLFPITHGLLWYMGFSVLPNFLVYRTDKANEEMFEVTKDRLLKLLENVNGIEPIRFRKQIDEFYTNPKLTLKEGVEVPGTTGFALHYM